MSSVSLRSACPLYTASCVFSFLTFLCELGMILFFIAVRFKRENKIFRLGLGFFSGGYFLFDALFWLIHFFIGSCYCYLDEDTNTYITSTGLEFEDYCPKSFSWTHILTFVIDLGGLVTSYFLFSKSRILPLIFVWVLCAQVISLWMVHFTGKFIDSRVFDPFTSDEVYDDIRIYNHIFDTAYQFRSIDDSKKASCTNNCLYGYSEESRYDQNKIAHYYIPNMIDRIWNIFFGKFTHLQVFSYMFVQFVFPNIIAFCSSFVIVSGSDYKSL